MNRTKHFLTVGAICAAAFTSTATLAALPEPGLVIDSSNVSDYSDYLLRVR